MMVTLNLAVINTCTVGLPRSGLALFGLTENVYGYKINID